jgi:hypothetical protein
MSIPGENKSQKKKKNERIELTVAQGPQVAELYYHPLDVEEQDRPSRHCAL